VPVPVLNAPVGVGVILISIEFGVVIEITGSITTLIVVEADCCTADTGVGKSNSIGDNAAPDKTINVVAILIFLWFFMLGANSFSMHIMEGFLPINWVIVWFVVCIPFWILGIKKLQTVSKGSVKDKMTLALAGAFIFVLSALKIPSVTGSSSHPTGVGLSAILYGPFVTSILGTIVLIFQAGLLAHGGFTTLGANAFSMAVAGPVVSYLIYKALAKKNRGAAIFLAAAIGDLATYVVTSFQLAFAYPSPEGGIIASFIKFGTVFAVTQIPLAVIEGLLTNVVMNILEKYNVKGVEA